MMDCGICSLLSIIRFYGGDVSKEYLRKLTNTSRDGVTAYNLIEAAKIVGMDAYGVMGDLNKIEENNLPCIAHVNIKHNYQHFVVIYKILKDKIVVMDPGKGKRLLTHSEFRLMSSNNYIFLKPRKKLPILKKERFLVKKLNENLKTNLSNYIFLFILTLNLLILEIIFAFNFKYIVSFSINYGITNNIYLLFICLIYIIILILIIGNLQKRLLFKIMSIFDFELTFNTYKRLLLLPYFYYNNRSTGEILSRFNDLNTIKNFIFRVMSSFIIDVISLIIFLIILVVISKELSFYIFIYILFTSTFQYLKFNKRKILYKNIKSLEDYIQMTITEALSCADTTKGCHLEKRFSDKFLLKYKYLIDNNYRYSCFLENNISFSKFIYNILLVLICCCGGYLVIKDKLTIENLIIFQTFFQYFLNVFKGVTGVIEEIPSYLVSLDRIEELYMILGEDFSKSYYFLPFNLNGKICFNNLNYSINNKIIFNRVSFTIDRCDKVLLFGSSGSGKSTLVKMLLRYVEVPFGMIKIDNIDINHYHLENLRRYITYVSSNEFLYTDTIYNNICLYQEISDERFMEIIKITRVNLIFGNELNNYKKNIEENGFFLSSGEKQRIILARSLVRKSNIYIFDEAFGQIDIELTNKILKDMFIYLKDKIVIVISHRQNGKKYFNRILNLKEANVYE